MTLPSRARKSESRCVMPKMIKRRGVGHHCEVMHRVSKEIFFPEGAAVNRKDQKQLQDIRRSHADTAVHVAKSREVIEDSLSLLERSDKGRAKTRDASPPSRRTRPGSRRTRENAPEPFRHVGRIRGQDSHRGSTRSYGWVGFGVILNVPSTVRSRGRRCNPAARRTEPSPCHRAPRNVAPPQWARLRPNAPDVLADTPRHFRDDLRRVPGRGYVLRAIFAPSVAV
jgi:hypothetical protein